MFYLLHSIYKVFNMSACEGVERVCQGSNGINGVHLRGIFEGNNRAACYKGVEGIDGMCLRHVNSTCQRHVDKACSTDALHEH